MNTYYCIPFFLTVYSVKVVEETAPSGKGKMERTPSQKTPRKNARASDLESGPGTSKGTSERKGRRGSGKGTGKENVKKESQSKGPKGPMQENTSINEKVSSVSLSTPSSSPHVQFGQVQPYGIIEASNKKVSGVLPVPTSSLPDLNTSALNNSTTSSATFRQPFTDSQQVQLRAQIFVYGSLMLVLYLCFPLFTSISSMLHVEHLNYGNAWCCGLWRPPIFTIQLEFTRALKDL